MITQRDLDIAQLEAKTKADRLFEEWQASYLGQRAKVQDGSGQGNGFGAEDSEAPNANDYESFGLGAEGASVLPGAQVPVAGAGY